MIDGADDDDEDETEDRCGGEGEDRLGGAAGACDGRQSPRQDRGSPLHAARTQTERLSEKSDGGLFSPSLLTNSVCQPNNQCLACLSAFVISEAVFCMHIRVEPHRIGNINTVRFGKKCRERALVDIDRVIKILRLF